MASLHTNATRLRGGATLKTRDSQSRLVTLLAAAAWPFCCGGSAVPFMSAGAAPSASCCCRRGWTVRPYDTEVSIFCSSAACTSSAQAVSTSSAWKQAVFQVYGLYLHKLWCKFLELLWPDRWSKHTAKRSSTLPTVPSSRSGMKLGRRCRPAGWPLSAALPTPLPLPLPVCSLGPAPALPFAAAAPASPVAAPPAARLVSRVRPTPTTKLSCCLGMMRGPAAAGWPSAVIPPPEPKPVMASRRLASSASETFSFGLARPCKVVAARLVVF